MILPGASPKQSANSQCRHERSTPMSTVSKLGTWRRERERASSAADSARSFDRADSAEGCEQGRGEGVGEGDEEASRRQGTVDLAVSPERRAACCSMGGGRERDKQWGEAVADGYARLVGGGLQAGEGRGADLRGEAVVGMPG